MAAAFLAAPFRVRRTGPAVQTVTRLALGAAVLTAIVVGLELLGPVHAVNPGGRGAIEATTTLAAIISAGLFAVSFQRSRRLPDLLLLYALIAVLVADFAYGAAPVFTGAAGLESDGAARSACELVAALAFASAAIAPGNLISRLRRGAGALLAGNRRGAAALLAVNRRGAAALLAVAGGVTVIVAELVGQVAGSPGDAGAVTVTGRAAAAAHPIVLVLQLAAAAALIAAALGFLRRTRRGELTCGPLAAAAFLLAGTRLQYVAMPAVATTWVTPREGLQLGGYALLLATGCWQYASARRAAAHAAIRSERERIARDLHDGLAQDLACIVAQGQRLGSGLDAEHPMMVAARRALAASRGAIVELAASTAPTTEEALRLVAADLEHRFGVQVEVRVEADTATACDEELDPTHREHLVRIAREAIVNAALHGAARHVDVLLRRRGDELLMQVRDDGCGIADSPSQGLGLRTMRARAASMGGELSARARAGGGTELELVLG
jgi:signal transduction histidine kinase